jgi:uncharacterized glyoxalase superfamily metalloenzyme YdcJ
MPDLQISSDQIRKRFSAAMSAMYRAEVPAYGDLMSLVADVNAGVLSGNPALRASLAARGELGRIGDERHGAIRLGTAAELSVIRRLFAVMGMYPVGYYDLSEAGVPVHATAFRPVDAAALAINPFRVFTSLLRLELIADADLRAKAAQVLTARQIFTPTCLTLIARAEAAGGLSATDADSFVAEALQTFRWQPTALVSHDLYDRLHKAHRLVADVVSFRGPHINHLTPRTLDIDAAQRRMPDLGIAPKAVIEGPPPRNCPILLRQTSFKALQEPVSFPAGDGWKIAAHTARFGEIEQRGQALTPKGRALYDRLLAAARKRVIPAADGSNAGAYSQALADSFAAFPDTEDEIRAQGLGYFYYTAEAGALRAEPLVYEDFLPVSAAGIFQSNLGDSTAQDFAASPNQHRFEADLGAAVLNEFGHYAGIEQASLAAAQARLARGAA